MLLAICLKFHLQKAILSHRKRALYYDEELQHKASDLRRKGYSYRQMARELGCSVYKVHELIPPYESPSSRLKQVAELTNKIDELNAKIRILDEKTSTLKSLDDFNVKLSKVEEIEAMKNEIVKKITDLNKRVEELSEAIDWIRGSARLRLRDDEDGCKWLDKDGYCILWYWSDRVRGWDMKPDTVNGKTVYKLNVKKHPLICAACPSYTPRGRV
jgi:predicted transcriptional regulator